MKKELTIRFQTLADIANYLGKAEVIVLDLDTTQRTLQVIGCPMAGKLAVDNYGALVVKTDNEDCI